eukprot:jgi/Ulvmu1/6172/UM028_0028.1
MEHTLCIIKPDAMRAQKEHEIMQLIELDGFHILEQRIVQLSHSHVVDFYSEHSGKPFFPNLQAFMTSGPILALILAKQDAINAWRALMGPTNSEVARETAPSTLRALYGTDGTKNAMHGSDSPQSAQREIKFFFPHREVSQMSADTEPTIPKSLEDALCKGLTELSKHKPSHDPTTAIVWLGDWLLQHNPHKPLVYGPDELPLEDIDDETDFPPLMLEQADEELQAGIQVDEQRHDAALAKIQRTLAMIKPDAVAAGHAQAIMDKIEAAGFKIVRRRYYTLYPAQAGEFYAEHKGKPFFDKLVEFMTGGPIWALELEREDGIAAWRSLMGPTDSLTAREDAPDSLRAQFGTDGTKNATHGSDCAESAAREIEFHFPSVETTLAMIKPDAVAAGYADVIMEQIERQGFKIVQKRSYQLTREHAQEFYSEHVSKPFFPRLLEFMTSGPIWALALEMPGAISAWRAMMGPTNSASARSSAPTTLRAQFGADGTMNAVHGSDSPESAEREIAFHFQNVATEQPDMGTPAADIQNGGAVTNIVTSEKTGVQMAEEQAAAVTVQAAVRGRQARQRVSRMQQDSHTAQIGDSEAIADQHIFVADDPADGPSVLEIAAEHEAADGPSAAATHDNVDTGAGSNNVDSGDTDAATKRLGDAGSAANTDGDGVGVPVPGSNDLGAVPKPASTEPVSSGEATSDPAEVSGQGEESSDAGRTGRDEAANAPDPPAAEADASEVTAKSAADP